MAAGLGVGPRQPRTKSAEVTGEQELRGQERKPLQREDEEGREKQGLQPGAPTGQEGMRGAIGGGQRGDCLASLLSGDSAALKP